MAAIDRINISADRYTWAIERAGLTVDEYIGSHPKVALACWIEGAKEPTIKQLEDFAKSVNVPFGYLFLNTVPTETIPFPLFRGEAGKNNHFDLNVYDTVNIVQQRQDWLEDYLIENEIDTCELVASVTIQTPIAETVNKLRTALQLESRWAFSITSTEKAVNIITQRLESAGIFVAYNGVVGNNPHRPLTVSECRGFALVNSVAPYIFVNNRDASTAQLFTLIHETAHLMLGISAGHAAEGDTMSHDIQENYCDQVAAEFLIPAQEIRTIWNGNIKTASRKFRVSELALARRAHNLGLLSDEAYRSFYMEYSNRPIKQKKESTGGDFYRTAARRVGNLFAIHVKNAVGSNQLSYKEAYRLTGLYGKTYTEFMNKKI